MSQHEHGWTVIECLPDERGADAVIGALGFFGTEAEALAFLADVRDDDPDRGDGWTIIPVRMFQSGKVAA